MSVATEFPPVVDIPARARQTMPRQSGPSVRHLVAVPVARPTNRPVGLLAPAEPARRKHNFNDSSLNWPLTVSPAPRPLRLTRRGMVAAVLATALLGVLLLWVASASASHAAATPKIAPGTTVTVGSGDTLWSIAQRIEPNRDPRLVVDQLRQLNHLSSVAVLAGQTLKVG